MAFPLPQNLLLCSSQASTLRKFQTLRGLLVEQKRLESLSLVLTSAGIVKHPVHQCSLCDPVHSMGLATRDAVRRRVGKQIIARKRHDVVPRFSRWNCRIANQIESSTVFITGGLWKQEPARSHPSKCYKTSRASLSLPRLQNINTGKYVVLFWLRLMIKMLPKMSKRLVPVSRIFSVPWKTLILHAYKKHG